MNSVDVIFRRHREYYDVVAVFPEIPTEITASSCKAFNLHIGFTSVIYKNFMIGSEPVAQEEYKQTYDELMSLGYSLNVIEKGTRNYKRVRRNRVTKELRGIT